MKNKRKNNKLWALFFVLTIIYFVAASPYIYRLYNLQELYYSKEAQDRSLDALFFIREEKGVAVSDMFLRDMEYDSNEKKWHVTIMWEYHGRLQNPQDYDDLKVVYYLEITDDEEYTLVDEKIVRKWW